MTDILYSEITLKLGPKLALDNVDLHLEGDQIIGIVGNRKAGKNYLLPMLPSFRYPTTGRLTVDGVDAFENSSIMTKVVYTWPTEMLHNSKKVIDGLNFCKSLRPNWDMKYALDLLRVFNLSPNAKIKKLNSRFLAVFNCICGLASGAPITVFDGTYMRLDDEQRRLFYKELRESHKKHPRMIILSTYDIAEIESFIDEAVILDKGKVIAHETVEKITKSAQEIMEIPKVPTLQEVFIHFTEEGGGENGQ